MTACSKFTKTPTFQKFCLETEGEKNKNKIQNLFRALTFQIFLPRLWLSRISAPHVVNVVHWLFFFLPVSQPHRRSLLRWLPRLFFLFPPFFFATVLGCLSGSLVSYFLPWLCVPCSFFPPFFGWGGALPPTARAQATSHPSTFLAPTPMFGTRVCGITDPDGRRIYLVEESTFTKK